MTSWRQWLRVPSRAFPFPSGEGRHAAPAPCVTVWRKWTLTSVLLPRCALVVAGAVAAFLALHGAIPRVLHVLVVVAWSAIELNQVLGVEVCLLEAMAAAVTNQPSWRGRVRGLHLRKSSSHGTMTRAYETSTKASTTQWGIRGH